MFVTFEGIDGVGKSTAIQAVAERLRSLGNREVVVCKTAGGTPEGAKIRELLLSKDGANLDNRACALLFLADMAQIDAKVIRPALEEGAIVLCDRFVDTTVVYQLICSGISKRDAACLTPSLGLLSIPNLTFLLHLPLSVAISRVQHRGGTDRFEKADEITWRDRAEAYAFLARNAPSRIKPVNVFNKAPLAIAEEIVEQIAVYQLDKFFSNLDKFFSNAAPSSQPKHQK